MTAVKAKRGRPRGTTKADAKADRLVIRISTATRAELERRAGAECLTVSAWVWQAILQRFARGVTAGR